jgi:intracellular sulfur oxidation DsrE/DsrF family protein
VQPGEKPSVVFHIDEDALWKRVLANVLNFLRAEGDGVMIEVLANGEVHLARRQWAGWAYLRP